MRGVAGLTSGRVPYANDIASSAIKGYGAVTMNDTKRTRHAFRPDVDTLEGRLVMSAGISANAAHVQQVKEQRQLLRDQRLERRLERRLQRLERHAALASGGQAGAQMVQIGSTRSSTTGGSSSSQSTGTRTALRIHPGPLNVPGRPTPGSHASGGLAANVAIVSPVTRTSGSTTTTGGLNPNPNSSVNLLLNGTTLAGSGAATVANSGSNIFNSTNNGTTSTTTTGSTVVNGVPFNNVSTAGTTTSINTGGVVLNNTPATGTTSSTNGIITPALNNAGFVTSNTNNMVTNPIGASSTTSALNNNGFVTSFPTDVVTNPLGAGGTVVINRGSTNPMVV
jgi:hypothetical protein